MNAVNPRHCVPIHLLFRLSLMVAVVQALIKLGAAREDRLRRVGLQVDENDIVFALQGVRFFRNILV